MREAKQQDPQRMEVKELFDVWWQHHHDQPLKLAELHDEVLKVLDPHARGRQWQARKIMGLAGTRCGGLMLERNKGSGKRSIATHRLSEIPSNRGKSPG